MADNNAPLIEAESIFLRYQQFSDVDRFIYWQTHGEWLAYDAPWEGFGETLTPEEEKNIRQHFLERCQAEKTIPPKSAVIVLKESLRPLGWVSNYSKGSYQRVIYIGINICEDDAMGRGLGTQALKLWITYLFTNCDLHKICLETWSFNPRMMHVAEKLGFTYEGAERNSCFWQDQWMDLVHYGLLRREWEIIQSHW